MDRSSQQKNKTDSHEDLISLCTNAVDDKHDFAANSANTSANTESTAAHDIHDLAVQSTNASPNCQSVAEHDNHNSTIEKGTESNMEKTGDTTNKTSPVGSDLVVTEYMQDPITSAWTLPISSFHAHRAATFTSDELRGNDNLESSKTPSSTIEASEDEDLRNHNAGTAPVENGTTTSHHPISEAIVVCQPDATQSTSVVQAEEQGTEAVASIHCPVDTHDPPSKTQSVAVSQVYLLRLLNEKHRDSRWARAVEEALEQPGISTSDLLAAKDELLQTCKGFEEDDDVQAYIDMEELIDPDTDKVWGCMLEDEPYNLKEVVMKLAYLIVDVGNDQVEKTTEQILQEAVAKIEMLEKRIITFEVSLAIVWFNGALLTRMVDLPIGELPFTDFVSFMMVVTGLTSATYGLFMVLGGLRSLRKFLKY